MRAILKREFRAYFQSPLGYVFVAALYWYVYLKGPVCVIKNDKATKRS
mgnify:CR=1 FL=1